MEKKPLIYIDEDPLEVLYESPSVMVVNKQRGMKVYPDNQSERGTLLNRLFQNNRWLAKMETNVSAGVLHELDLDDHGLMIFNKNDDYTETINRLIENQEISFSFFITVKGNHLGTSGSLLLVYHNRV